MINYNVHEAISYRGKTLDQIGLGQDNPKFRNDVIDFRESIQIATLDDYPYPPLSWEVLGGDCDRRDLTKQVWVKRYRSYRLWIKNN